MINLLISDAYIDRIDGQKLEMAALEVLKHEKISAENDLSIAIEDDARLQELNNEFLGIDAPTDVLSFPAGEGEIDPETNHPYLGDIIISYPRAVEQAGAAGHPAINEMQLLVVHGMLHLLGYDHADPEEKAEMWTAQAEILHDLGVEITRLPE